MRLSIIVIFILAGLVVFPVQAKHHTLVVSVEEEAKDGPDAKILTAIAEELNAEKLFQYAPFKRRLLMMERGDIDMVCGLLRRPEREAYIHYVLPPYKKRSDTIFFVPKGNTGQIRSYEDLKILKIGEILKTYYTDRKLPIPAF